MAIGLLHLADVHLGDVANVAGGPALAAERLETLSAALAEAARRRAAAVLIAGDLFEERFAVRELAAAVAARLAAAERPVFLAPGNHDPARPGSYYRSFDWPANVTIFREEEPRPVALPDAPLTVHGLGWTGGAIHTPALREYRVPADGRAHVLLLHADLDPPGGDSAYRPLASADAAATRANYVALGHVHTRRLVPLPAHGARTVAAYCGSLYPLGFGEEGSHGALWAEVEPGVAGARTEFLPLAKRRYHTLEVVCEAEWAAAELAAACRAALPAEAARDLVRFRLNGATPDAGWEEEALRAELDGAAFHIEVDDRTEPAADLDALIADNPRGLAARFVRTLRERLASAPLAGSAAAEAAAAGPRPAAEAPDRAVPAAEAEELEVLRLALRYGVQALTGRRITPL